MEEAFETWFDEEEERLWKEDSSAGRAFRERMRDQLTRNARFTGKRRVVVWSDRGEEIESWEIDEELTT